MTLLIIFSYTWSTWRKLFRLYFLPSKSEYEWMKDGFQLKEISEIKTLSFIEQEQLVKLSCDGSLIIAFQEDSLRNFWLCMRSMYAILAEKGIKHSFRSAPRIFVKRLSPTLCTWKTNVEINWISNMYLRLTDTCLKHWTRYCTISSKN